MNVKLTLSLNKETVERAKKHLQPEESLSKIVENYFDLLVDKREKRTKVNEKLRALDKLRGIAKGIKDPDKAKYEYLVKKYK